MGLYDYLREHTASIDDEIRQTTMEMLQFLEVEYSISDEVMVTGTCNEQAKSLLRFMYA
jgi:hypothetical protein